MLVSVDRSYHNLIKNKLLKVTEMAKTYFSRMNEIEFSPVKSERIGGIDMCDLKNWDIKFRIKCWPYSKMGPGVEFECDLNNNHFTNLIDDEPAFLMKKRKASRKNDNDGDYEVDVGNGNGDDDDDVLLDKEDFDMERRYLSDCIIERAKEDSSNLIPLPKPKESSLFYTNTKLVTRTSVHELTSFLSTDKQKQ